MPRARPDTTTSPARPVRAPACRRICAPAPKRCARPRWRPSRAQRCGMAQHGDQRRRRIQRRQAMRKIRLAGRDQAPAQLRQRLHLARAVVFRRQDEILAAAARCQARQFVQRGGGAAETGDQAGEGDRADMFGARQPQPGAAFASSLSAHLLFFAPMRGSSPRSRRRIFSRCMKKISSRQQQRQRRIVVATEQQEIDRRQRDGDQGRKRRDAPDQRRHQPGRRHQQPHRPVQREGDAEIGGHAFAALESQPDGKEMAQHRGQRGEDLACPAPENGAPAAPRRRPWRHRTAMSPPPPISCRCAAHWWRRYCPSRSCAHRPRRKRRRRTGRTESSPADSRAAGPKQKRQSWSDDASLFYLSWPGLTRPSMLPPSRMSMWMAAQAGMTGSYSEQI